MHSADNVIRGPVIQRFTPFTAIHVFGAPASGNHIERNFVGTDASGMQPRGNRTPPVSCAAVWLSDGAHAGNTSAFSAAAAIGCAGDCNGDGQVRIEELLRLVGIALGEADIGTCPAGDGDGNQQITVNEILTAVNHALSGCPLR